MRKLNSKEKIPSVFHDRLTQVALNKGKNDINSLKRFVIEDFNSLSLQPENDLPLDGHERTNVNNTSGYRCGRASYQT